MTLPFPALWEWAEATAVALFIKDSVWAYPILETVHLIGLGLVFGGIFAFDLRVLGVNSDLPASRMHRHLLPWVWTGFALNAASGLLMLSSDAVEFSTNPALAAKLALLAAAGVNAAIFQFRFAPGMMSWDRNTRAPAAAQANASLSIALWIAIIIAGRLMAYVK
jgi:hypothetical protein